MKRRNLRLATMLVSVLACSLFASTSSALYLTSIGPAQCCTSHCGHAMPKRSAERCCRTHLTAAPAAIGKVAASDVAPAVATPLAMPLRLASSSLAFAAAASTLRAPPGGPLVVQHTSLAV